jgi:phytoene desaturase
MKTVQGKSDHIVVVGAGLGGLATAMRLAGAGRKVTVLERESVPGGRAGIWEADGHLFDTGPTVLTMPGLIDDAFAALGEETKSWLELEPVSPLYRTYYPEGSQLDVHSDV